MVLALSATVLSVLIGAGLALAPGGAGRWLGPVRTFALTAALGVVLTHLLPDAFVALGGWSLVALVGGLLVPTLLQRLVKLAWSQRAGSQKAIGLEAGYAGLVVHQFGDGVGLGAYTGLIHAGDAQHDVVVALAAHTVPVVAIVVLAFDAAGGRRTAVVRAIGLAGASLLGVLLTAKIPVEVVQGSGAWISALVAGLLVNVVTHDLGSQPPRTSTARGFDFIAGAAGVAVSWVGIHDHGETGTAALRERVWSSLVDMSIETGPMLLLGLVAGALLQTFGSKIPSSWLRSRGSIRDALRGTVVGAPMPLCSCGVLPVSGALHRQQAAPALVVAFLIATPELGIETFAITVRMLGWPYALVRLGGALLVAFAAAVVVGRILRRRPVGSPKSVQLEEENRPSVGRFLSALDDLVHHIGPWMVMGIVAAAFIEAFLPADALGSLGSPWIELLVITAVSIPSYICAPSATPLAAVLIAKGLSPGAVLVALLLGPATNVATVAFLRNSFGVRAAVGAVATIILVAWGLAFAVNAWVPVAIEPGMVFAHHNHGLFWVVGTLGFLVLLARSVWVNGARASLGVLFSGSHEHDHHGHGHGHGNCCSSDVVSAGHEHEHAK